MKNKRGPHPPLSKVEAYHRLRGLKRGVGVATVVGFGVLGGLAFPHGVQASPLQASGLAAAQKGVDAIGGFFNAVGSALFGQDGQGQDQTGQGGYGFGSTSAGAPTTGSGVS